jgi:lipopolysaccharide transport system permease protein
MSDTTQPKTAPTFTIQPPRSWLSLDWKELLDYRELLGVFTWRDIKVRYKQTFLGIAWAVLQPFLVMVVFSVFFGRLIQVPSDGVPYPIFVYCGLLFWNYFSSALTNASNSLTGSAGMIQKVYFPRLILPLSSVITPIIDYGFAFLVFIGLLFYYHFIPTFTGLLLIPLLLLISLVCSLGIGLFFASANVKFRDVRFILPFFIQLLMYVTPVIYPVSIIPEKLRWIIYLNPMSGVITAARNSFLGTAPIDWTSLLISFAISVLFLLFGLWYFKRTERFFADVI